MDTRREDRARTTRPWHHGDAGKQTNAVTYERRWASSLGPLVKSAPTAMGIEKDQPLPHHAKQMQTLEVSMAQGTVATRLRQQRTRFAPSSLRRRFDAKHCHTAWVMLSTGAGRPATRATTACFRCRCRNIVIAADMFGLPLVRSTHLPVGAQEHEEGVSLHHGPGGEAAHAFRAPHTKKREWPG